MTRRETILATIDGAVRGLLYYDRKEDEELEVGAIQEAVAEGEITTGEMVGVFVDALDEWWEDIP